MLFRLKRVLKAKATIRTRTRTNANTHMNNMSTTLRQEAPSTIRATLKHLHGRLSIEDTTNNMVSHQRIRLQLRCQDFPFQLKLPSAISRGTSRTGRPSRTRGWTGTRPATERSQKLINFALKSVN
jgi:hypothetical protein